MNPTSVRPAQVEDLPEMCSLLANGSRSYANVGVEDLPGLLQRNAGAAVQVDSQKVTGLVVLQQEEFPRELYVDAPVRVSQRAAATKLPAVIARKQFLRFSSAPRGRCLSGRPVNCSAPSPTRLAEIQLA